MADQPPPLPPMLEAILQAARAKFSGNDWPMVEVHLHKAWNAVAHETPWENVCAGARHAWEASGAQCERPRAQRGPSPSSDRG